jgi:ribokinase
MKNKIIYVSGIINFETIVDVDAFPIYYRPIEYPFFGVNSTVSGQAYNIAKALKTLGGNEVILSSHVGKDFIGKIAVDEIAKLKIDTSLVNYTLDSTPNAVAFVDRDNNTMVYNDIKNIQDVSQELSQKEIRMLKKSDVVVLSNTNFNRPILAEAKKLGKLIATDVHIISNIEDEHNREFMEASDILFLSNKGLGNLNYEDFLLSLYEKYHNKIIVLGEGREGAMILDSKKKIIYHIDAITLRQIINTVGSRDALFSAFIHFYLRKMNSLKALELAEVFTSYKLGESGGAKGFLKASAVRKISKSVDFDVYEIKKF